MTCTTHAVATIQALAIGLPRDLWITSSTDVSRYNVDNFQSDPEVPNSSYLCNRSQPQHRVQLLYNDNIPFVLIMSIEEAIKRGYTILSITTGQKYHEQDEMKR
mmetsp:Transcript_12383/g.49882  ORF Transcript_12383/g.49882 Transcript_12383/m.49882 type:complete len:104 (+) Transcript_12383:69-380(+)